MQPGLAIRRIAEAAGAFPTPGNQVLIRKHTSFAKAVAGDPGALVEVANDLRVAASLDAAPAPAVTIASHKATKDVRVFGLGTARERKQAAVLAGRLARVAAEDPLMLRFREGLFGSRDPLRPTAARGVLASRILAFMSRPEMDKLGIPIVGHVATVTRLRTGLDGQVGHWTEFKIRIRWRGGKHTETRRLPLDPSYAVHKRLREVFGRQASAYGLLDHVYPYLLFPAGDGRERRLQVYPGSVFDLLRRAAKGLAGQMGWGEADAVSFIVSGATPPVSPVTAIRRTWATGMEDVMVTGLAFVSRATVAEAFARATRSVTGGTVGACAAALVAFVNRRTEENGGRRPPWRQLWTEWQRQRPSGCRPYREYPDFRRTYCRAVEERRG
jgi:hypothetical protein